MTVHRTISRSSKPEPLLISKPIPGLRSDLAAKAGSFSDAIYVAIEGNAELIRDKAIFKAHWTSGLDRWFDKGVDTPNIVLIKVTANRTTYWDGEEEGEVRVYGIERPRHTAAPISKG
jgi:hypothetical protein